MAKKTKNYIVQKDIRILGNFHQTGDEISLLDFQARQCGNAVKLKPKKVKKIIKEDNDNE